MFSNSHMQVIKRSGQLENVSFDKVITRIKALCAGLEKVDPIVISQKVCSQIKDKIHTFELDELAAEICVALLSENINYGILASRIIISNNHKNTSPSFSEVIQTLYNNIDVEGKSSPLISDDVYKVVMKNKGKINSALDYKRDFDFDYFAFKTLEKAYLLKIADKCIERPQHMFMRVSIGLHTNNISKAIETYHYLSQKYFTHATPTLFHSGTPNPQLLSCFLLGTSDEVKPNGGIYKTISDCAVISKWAGGIGVHISNIRCKGSKIRGTNGKSDGIIPMLKVYNDTAKYINQSGKRPGSFAIYLEPHHPDIMDFLDLKKNHGNEDDRARDLFYAMWISDHFMECVKNNKEWCLFDPDECKGLNNVYGDAYKELYEKYENSGKARKKISATVIWEKILDSQIETGLPYILFKDAANKKSNQQNYGVIKSSNLCAEILEYSDDKEYACCTLASLSLPKFVEDAKFNYEKLAECVGVAINNLNRIVDINYYPLPETEISNKKHRPLGLGVQGLADVFFKLRIPFDSTEARTINRNIFETIYYNAVKTSCEIAKIDGPYSSFAGSPISNGQFQFDLWDVKPSDRYDWDSLRADVKTHGIRNSLLVALMPTATTSQILGNIESIEPQTSNLYIRNTTAGSFTVINKYLVDDLIKLNLWSPAIKNMIIAADGSIQNIDGIPVELKEIYKTVWEIKQRVLIDMAVDRGAFVCQTQSMNLFFEEPTRQILHSALFHGWKNGLKTGSYYIRSRPKIKAQQFTIEPETVKKSMESVDAQKLICSIKNKEACDMCSA